MTKAEKKVIDCAMRCWRNEKKWTVKAGLSMVFMEEYHQDRRSLLFACEQLNAERRK